jgi:hypothetical protein
LLIRLIGQGRWQSEGIRSNKHAMHSGARALSYRLDGRRVVTVEGQWIIGLVFYVVLAGVGIWSLCEGDKRWWLCFWAAYAAANLDKVVQGDWLNF